MPRSALLCTKIEIREPAYTCDLKIECSERKRGAAAKMHFATAPCRVGSYPRPVKWNT